MTADLWSDDARGIWMLIGIGPPIETEPTLTVPPMAPVTESWRSLT